MDELDIHLQQLNIHLLHTRIIIITIINDIVHLSLYIDRQAESMEELVPEEPLPHTQVLPGLEHALEVSRAVFIFHQLSDVSIQQQHKKQLSIRIIHQVEVCIIKRGVKYAISEELRRYWDDTTPTVLQCRCIRF